ncbi:MAG: 2-succinyl-5-enolpyruvyl-6-hydroxy-3-cyclohexene-1-carboxylic-acid synthase [Thermoleophilaceae bacterium]
MIPLNRTYAPIQAFVDELARCGLRHAVTCPGSRNAPLLLTLAAEPRIDATSILDERSAGYFALGLAKATERPVAITVTSGSAVANLAPAVAEAREARVPLIVLSADRPPELRDVGAGQSIDQLKVFGSAAKWFVEMGSHEPGRSAAVHHRAHACRAFSEARDGRPGPVHVNFPLREPLAPVREELDPEPWQGRPEGRPWVEVTPAFLQTDEEDPAAGIALEVAHRPRGAVVCGATHEDLAESAALLGAAAGWPILAEPTSNVRCGAHDRSHVVSHYDVLLRCEEWAAEYRPELVIRVGDTPTSKPLRAWLASAGRQVLIDPHLAWHDPTREVETIVAGSPGRLLREIAESLAGLEGPLPAVPVPTPWLSSWLEADALVPPALAAAPEPLEPSFLAALADVAPEGSTVWVASSMPVRDVESFFPSTATPLRFLANRGANGIDGVVSSALGAALAGHSGRCYLLTGELSLLHDVGGLVTARRHGIELTIVCLNNGGGGIFDFLPVAEHADPGTYEEHLATPTPVDLRHVAALGGLEHTLAATPDDVRAAADRPGLVEVRIERSRNVALHREVFAGVVRQLERGRRG